MSEPLEKMVGRIHEIQDRREAELRKLLENPTLAAFAQQWMDLTLNALTGLFNYDHVVDTNGKALDTTEVYADLSDQLRRAFGRLTGGRYVSETFRNREHRLAAAGEARAKAEGGP